MNNDLKKLLKKLEQSKVNTSGFNITFDSTGLDRMVKDILAQATPEYGVDYFTEAEIRQIIDVVLREATPVKGKDYWTPSEVADMIRTVQSRVKDGKDGRDGRDGRDGKDAEPLDPRQVAIDAINFLENFEGDARLSAKALKDLDEAVTKVLKSGLDFTFTEGQIKTIKDLLPQYPPMNAGGSGATFLKSLRDVDLSGLTKNADGKYVLGGGSGASSFLGLSDTPSDYTGQAGKVVAVNVGEDGLEFISASGVGTVTSVAISGSDGIEVDSGSPITAAGTIALGLNKASTLTFLNVEDGAEVNTIDTVADTSEIDLTVSGRQLTASIVAGSIDESKLDTSVNASLDLADSAVQPSDLATVATTGAYSDLSGTPDLSGYQVEPVVVSGSLTASNDIVYHNTASATYTDPSPTEGKGFVVFVRNGTATVGGTGYSTAGTIVHRIYHSGAWANYVYLNKAQLDTTYQPLDADLTAIAALANTDGNIIVGNGSTWVAESGATARTSLGLGTGDSPQFTGIELGNASDTTLTRSAAGVLAVEGVVIPSISSTNTLTNKRVTPRVTSITSNSATPTINTDNCDFVGITGQTNNITSMTTNLSGTPTNGQMLRIAMTAGSGTPTVTWGASFEDSTVTAPTALSTTRVDVGFVWNAATSKWRCVAKA